MLRRVSAGSTIALLLVACHALAAPSSSPKPAAQAVAPAQAPKLSVPTAPADDWKSAAGSPLLQRMEPVAASKFCTTDGKVGRSGNGIHVDVGAMRGVLTSDRSKSAEVDFTYRGPSKDVQALASGELRRQVGVKLKAQDSCNVVYAMWHIAPDSGVFVLVKRNPGKSSHEECKDGGYITPTPTETHPVAAVAVGVPHTLRADIIGQRMRVTADGALAWEGALPAAANEFDGPPGVRTDNGTFDFQLQLPNGAKSAPSCQ